MESFAASLSNDEESHRAVPSGITVADGTTGGSRLTNGRAYGVTAHDLDGATKVEQSNHDLVGVEHVAARGRLWLGRSGP